MNQIDYRNLAEQYDYPHLASIPNLGDLLRCAVCTDINGLAYYSGIADREILIDLMILADEASWLGYRDGSQWIPVEF